jgi:tripartite-type tricarboxylate transporter receptor subunit TctC
VHVAQATDGHTRPVGSTSTMTVNHLPQRGAPYQPLLDLLPVATITASPSPPVGAPRARPDPGG